MLVRTHGSQTQIVILEGPVLVEHYVTRPDRASMVGNIYLGKARNVLPGMEAAFLEDRAVLAGHFPAHPALDLCYPFRPA